MLNFDAATFSRPFEIDDVCWFLLVDVCEDDEPQPVLVEFKKSGHPCPSALPQSPYPSGKTEIAE